MSEELQQRDLIDNPPRIGNFTYYNIGQTTLNQLKKARIIPNRDYGKYGVRKPDILLVDRTNASKPFVIVALEQKDGGKFNTEKDQLKAVQQCNDLAQVLDAKIGISTDGDSYIWFNPNQKNKNTEYKDKTTSKKRSYTIISKENAEPLREIFKIEQRINEINVDNLKNSTRDTYLLVNNLCDKLDKNNSIISSPKSINPLKLAKNVWQAIWIATGKSPEKCLYNVVEIFIFKFLSDLEVLKEPANFEYLYSLYDKGNSDADVLDYYAKICRKKIQELFKKNPKDDTTIINGTIFVDEHGNANPTQAILFKNTIKTFKEFENEFGKLKNIDKDFKTKLYETFLKQTQGLKGLGQYFTPRKVVRAIVNMSGIDNLTDGQRVCDPFCGVGGFVLEPLNLYDNLKRNFVPRDGKINPKIILEGYDKAPEPDDDRTIILAKANMLIYLSDIVVKYSHLTEEFTKVFNNTFSVKRSNLGILDVIKKEDEKCDLILTNPPYVTKGKKTILNEINSRVELKNFYKINSIGIEGLALEWIIRNLKKGGSAFIIVPDGLLNRLRDKRMRSFILQECYLNGIVSLPRKTFFATPKKTYILSITKKHDNNDIQDFPVFTYLIKDIGERLDVTRFDIPENNLLDMVSLYNQFKGDKNNFKTNDTKCKIQSIEKFVKEPSWIIDRWWTEKEREKMNIVDITDVLTLEGLQEKISELQDSLKEATEELKNLSSSENLEFVEKELGELFDMSNSTNNSKMTRSFVDQNKGIIPVFSASKDPDFTGYGMIKDNLPNVKYFQDCLTWNIDGYVGKAFFRKGRFTLSEKVIPLILREEYKKNVSYEYVKYVIEKESIKKELNFSNKAGKSRISDIKIKIPVKKVGNEKVFDFDKQKELAEKYETIEDVKEQIVEELNSFKEFAVEL